MSLRSFLSRFLTYLGIYGSIDPTTYPVVNPGIIGFPIGAAQVIDINSQTNDIIKQWSAKCGLSVNTTKGLDSKIVGGIDVNISDYPWQVSLQRQTSFGFSHFCGGSLIHPQWVLTAAHCLEWTYDMTRAEIISSLRVIAGTQTITPSTNSLILRVNNVIINPNYDTRRGLNDIALISIETSVSLLLSKEFAVNSVCLPTKNQRLSHVLTTSGWGTTEEDGYNSYQLKSVDLPLVPSQQCQHVYSSSFVPQTMICAGTQGKDSCQGDSGGGLTQKNQTKRSTIVGIVSVGNGCGRQGYPGIYTKVSYYIDWIKSFVRY